MERKRLVERMDKLDKQYSKILPGEGCRAGGLLRSDFRKNRQKKKCMEDERQSQHWVLILRELLLVGDQTCLRIVPSAHGESRALILHFFPECLCATD